MPEPTLNDHGCLATRCHRRVNIDFAFCKHHWDRMPSSLKDPFFLFKPDSSEYDLAVQDAVIYFEKMEGLI